MPQSTVSVYGAVPDFESEGLRVAAFIERYCRHSKGRWAGDRILLEAWQKWALNEIFRIDSDSGFRYWRKILWMIPRKNAKSTIISAAGHYLLGFDGEGGPEVFSAAWGAEQAGVTMEAAKAKAGNKIDNNSMVAKRLETFFTTVRFNKVTLLFL